MIEIEFNFNGVEMFFLFCFFFPVLNVFLYNLYTISALHFH